MHLGNLLQQLVGLLRSKDDMCEILHADTVITAVIVTEQRLDGIGAEQGMRHERTRQPA